MSGVLQRRHFWSVSIGVLAALYVTEVSLNNWLASEQLLLDADSDAVMGRIVDLTDMPKWIPIIKRIKRSKNNVLLVDLDCIIMSCRLRFERADEAAYNVVWQSRQSWLRPRVVMNVTAIDNGLAGDRTNLEMAIGFQRKSLLFQATLGVPLRFLARQQLRRSLFLLKTMLN